MRGYFLEQNDLSKMIKYTLAFNVDIMVSFNYVKAKSNEIYLYYFSLSNNITFEII